MSSMFWTTWRARFMRHSKRLKRVFALGFALVVLVLLTFAIRDVEWREVFEALRALPRKGLMIAGVFAAASYLLYSTFDLLGRWYTRRSFVWWRAVLVGFVSYAFTMSLGALVGVLGLRLRLYSKQGLDAATIIRIMALVLVTNWVGYLFAAAAVLLWNPDILPWGWGSTLARVLGVSCAAVAGGYVLLSAYAPQRRWRAFGHVIELPSARQALIQSVLGVSNWLLIAGVLYFLFQAQVAYWEVLGVLLISAVAGALAHVPGAVGVLEYVFIHMMEAVARDEVLAVLLVYRLFYYIIPLLLGALVYAFAEALFTKSPESSP